MKKYIYILVVSFGLISCITDDYLVDGGISSGEVGSDTFTFLQSHPQLDTLALLIQRADLIDEVNGENTLFAPNNLSIQKYVDEVLAEMRQEDPEAEYTVNDIPVDTLQKYMGGYIFPGRITRDDMSADGDILTALNGEERRISLEPREEYTDQLSSFPEYVFFTYKNGDDWDDWDNIIDDDVITVRTSNLVSTNGMIHVLQGNHILFNYDN
ncbi:fasciclin domain-containing protein [Echinicola sp. CAU 1574]|uniref:Fasciclin domain-containing protein n=1 Tax=Echinicola arenosa TaxID=2774144 RepID=A0ABR9AID4_9BACT|nr:fasciclin domain-containing protein [Echinicola arenosa]MBD8488072.1 fasciclin domain-containing protein [Echinicola arenosa]